MDIILLGFIASGLAGLATAAGALPVFFVNKLSEKFEDGSLGFAAGVMLAASFFSLIIPGFNFAVEMYDSEIFSLGIVIVGLLTGAGIIWIVEDKAPHEHFVLGQTHGVDEKLKAKISKVWLFIIAITLHNMPEGLAVGVGFGGGDIDNGISLATGIGLQNIPEGLAVAFSLKAIGYSNKKAFLISAATGLFEPIMGLLGVSIVTIFQHFLPVALGFAAGAMLFVISHEIIPESHSRGNENTATVGFIIGLTVMMSLDILLG